MLPVATLPITGSVIAAISQMRLDKWLNEYSVSSDRYHAVSKIVKAQLEDILSYSH